MRKSKKWRTILLKNLTKKPIKKFINYPEKALKILLLMINLNICKKNLKKCIFFNIFLLLLKRLDADKKLI